LARRLQVAKVEPLLSRLGLKEQTVKVSERNVFYALLLTRGGSQTKHRRRLALTTPELTTSRRSVGSIRAESRLDSLESLAFRSHARTPQGMRKRNFVAWSGYPIMSAGSPSPLL
jgi:hypothetical protein